MFRKLELLKFVIKKLVKKITFKVILFIKKNAFRKLKAFNKYFEYFTRSLKNGII